MPYKQPEDELAYVIRANKCKIVQNIHMKSNVRNGFVHRGHFINVDHFNKIDGNASFIFICVIKLLIVLRLSCLVHSSVPFSVGFM